MKQISGSRGVMSDLYNWRRLTGLELSVGLSQFTKIALCLVLTNDCIPAQ